MYFEAQPMASPTVAEERIATASGPRIPMSWRSASRKPKSGQARSRAERSNSWMIAPKLTKPAG
jgi:hypothetical protein